ncbi:MAG: HEPN domain-containing protein [Pontiellaceae bacterium]|nr:HEPN domain-containing protein [Pontiellaceae bacterium]
MKPLTLEWIEKAEGDFHSLQREVRARKYPNYDAACYHAQQCAEKYLKGRLTEADLSFPKTHDLVLLLDLILLEEPLWETHRADLALLSSYGVEFRYPGESADAEMAKDANKRCRAFRTAVRLAMRLPSEP